MKKVFMELNGARQGMFISESNEDDLPVLLYLHGGLPDYFLNDRYPTGLDQFFTMVWWEQRGSGMSYDPRATRSAITVEQLIDDTLALSRRLSQRYGQEKVYLMAPSGGTFPGIQAVARAPKLFHAYIAVAQISDQLESEVLAYHYMLAECRKRGFNGLARKLERNPVTTEGGAPIGYMRVRDTAMHKLGVGTMRQMKSVLTGIFLPSLLCSDYTILERIKLWAAKAQSGASVVWDTVLSTDLREQIQEVDVPVYFFHGVHDYTCSYPLARDFLNRLRAPVKGFYTFENSAHSPIFEEPLLSQRIICEDVLRGRATLADDAIAGTRGV